MCCTALATPVAANSPIAEEPRKSELRYDPSRISAIGSWTDPFCQTTWRGDDHMHHDPGCINTDSYAGCIYTFGPAEVEAVKEGAARCSDPRRQMTSGPLTLEILQEKFSELL